MKSIGVFFGSRNPEHDVSIITGQLVLSELKKLGYPVVPVYISKTGEWFIGEEFGSLSYFTGKGQALPKTQYVLDMAESTGKMVFKQKGLLLGKKTVIDIAFPTFHGQYGEDGTFQGLCEIIGLPYVGCDVESSAITMDKIMTKMIYMANDIPTTSFMSITQKDFGEKKNDTLDSLETKLNYPVIVKPARLGSSIGIAKAKNRSELEFAVEVALKYDEKAIVETCIVDLMDVTCCVIGNEEPTMSHLQESLFDADVFSYEDKYLNDGGAQLGNAKQNIFIPARLDEKTTKEIQHMAGHIYKLLGCAGISRVDFLYDKKTKKYYANEVNTLPGTLYHHLWKESGVSLANLIERLIGFAQERFETKSKLTHTFQSDILNNAGATKLQLKGPKNE